MFEIQKLKLITEIWGGDIIESDKNFDGSGEVEDGFSLAPFTNDNLGIIWEEKIIVYSGEIKWYEVVHEMGHVFASDKDPNTAGLDEFSFFGWEYLLGRKIKAPMEEWFKFQSNYNIDDKSTEFGSLNRKDQRNLLAERIKHAKKIGLIKKGKLVSIRT